MGEHVKLREATERANASLAAVKELVPYVNSHGDMLNVFGQMLYEISNRISALEIVLSRYLDSNSSLSFSELLALHIAEQQAKEYAQSDTIGNSQTHTTEEEEPTSNEESTNS